ncbi:BTAD domain-containing putative transcriptional regulator [Actinomycetospora cinnamomea]|uniref:Putative ATPase n=1 Tax=Actinomycetospora cinnamomea TaxID=663609 RepID=A0A2U1F8G1_9PSEU|nr:BTAD domain-containing putative transcriptional regulator [Actinomycetospora cinnamomea]PVZ08454.1 putative ATPase [Actinomycetospora cinnamomea]
MAVEFRLLGEIDVRLGGHELDIGHARQRCVLAALLVDVDRAVPVDQLIDRVWADRPPHRARNALSAYVSRLRHLLAGVPGVRITRGPGGYALGTDPLAVDLHRFRRLVAEARAAHRPADALALHDRALGLWRGEPFATIDTPWFDGLRTSLVAERLAATLDRNDAALRAGRHADLLAEIAAALRDHPLDERLAGQLMLAQVRSGRQADALDTYQQMRRRLRDELGADPGAALREVHEQVLAGDAGAPVPVGVAPVADPAPGGPARPPPGPAGPAGNLPRRVTSFVGREADAARVVAALRDGPLVTLTGVGGVGKSRLAVECAVREQSRFPDGAWLCELAALDDDGPVSDAVAVALRVRQRQGLTIEQTVIEYLRGRELLLVLDNCEHVLEATARLVDQVVQHAPGVVVIATSREALAVEGERLLPLVPLSAGDGAALFAERARTARPDLRLDGEHAAVVSEVCRRLDGLPLAIELAAARVRVMSPAEVAGRLDRGRLLRLGTRGSLPHHQSLKATIDWSYRLLSEPEKTLFARLSVFTGGFDLAGAHGVCGDPGAVEDDTLDLLAGLVEKSLVTVRTASERSRYGVLETLRAFGRERLREAGAEAEIGQAHARYFATLGGEVARALHGRDERAWVERTLPDYDNLRTAFERAVADRDVDTALVLVTSVSELVHLRVGYEWAGWAERTLELVHGDHSLRVAAVGAAAPGPGTAASSPRRAHWPSGPAGPCPGGAPHASPTRGTSSPTSRSTRATPSPRCTTTRARCDAHVPTATRSGWCGPCTTSRSAARCCARPSRACPRPGSRSRWPGPPATRRRCRWRATPWASC